MQACIFCCEWIVTSKKLGGKFITLYQNIYRKSEVFAVLLKCAGIAFFPYSNVAFSGKKKLFTTFKSLLVVIACKVQPYVD